MQRLNELAAVDAARRLAKLDKHVSNAAVNISRIRM
jgi:hypothetical protein